jgi:lysine 6-dehydrogenase
MVNILAQHGIDLVRGDGARVTSVRIFVGGLPQHPEPPLHYQIVYSLEGVLDYYTTRSWVVRDGRRQEVAALSEIERVDVDGVGELEAFHTAGGLSTMAWRYEGEIPTMEYKTLRYPGHARLMEAVRELGFLELDAVDVKGQRVVPRDVAVAVMGPRLRKPKSPDLVALRVVVEGERADGGAVARAWELVDRYDAERGISAMMRTTGYSLSITGQLQARGEVAAGSHARRGGAGGGVHRRAGAPGRGDPRGRGGAALGGGPAGRGAAGAGRAVGRTSPAVTGSRDGGRAAARRRASARSSPASPPSRRSSPARSTGRGR